ncbi:hypothetical protein CDL15_Pgr021930 [Punica granatum]|uniref:Uncharacterized protein n=1 Tax=Punica granatum TaxID=22663 RepID=A0A218XIS4_PUNGR|nr:hypothetical protein CDL15_Pgr021930 [Punica granatum]
MGQSASADVPNIPPNIRPHPYLPLYSTHFTAFRTSRPLYCFLDSTSRPLYCFLDFASTDFASALLLYGLRVHGLRVRFIALWTSRPLYCFMDFTSTDFASTDFASALLLYGLRVHRLRVRFTAFWTSRPLYCSMYFASTDFESALLLSGLRVCFTAFRTSCPRTSRPFYCFLRASALHLPLHIPQIPITLLSHDRGGDPGYYSSPGNQRQTCGHRVINHRRRVGSIRKAEESSRKNLQTKNPENDGAGTVALFITESPKHQKVPNMGLQKSLSGPK